MYMGGSRFEEKRTKEHVSFIQNHPFGLVVTMGEDAPLMTHLPLLVREDNEKISIVGHLSNKNEHSKFLDNNRCWVVFNGAQSYVSSKWYERENEIPTWNYVSLHCEGVARTFAEEHRLKEHLVELIDFCEHSTSRKPISLDPFHPKHRPMLKEITGFVIEVDRIQHKKKLGQNLTVGDREGAVKSLEGSANPASRELAVEMKKTLEDVLY